MLEETEDVAREDQIFLRDNLGGSAELSSDENRLRDEAEVDADFKQEEKARIEAVNSRFNEKIDELSKSDDAKSAELHLGSPGDILKSAGIIGERITLQWDLLEKKRKESYRHDHPFEIEDIKDLPIKINNPIAIFKSRGHGDFNILVELQRDGKNFIVSLKARVQPTSKGKIVVEDVVTLYPKNEKGIVNWMLQGLGRYYNKEKALDWLSRREPHAHSYTAQELDDAAKVVKKFDAAKEKQVNGTESSVE